jgi:lysozyme
MKINEKGLALIKECESCKLKSYRDIVGIWTIGWGHTGSEVNPDLIWTQEQADNQLRQDLGRVEDGVSDRLEVDVNENQFSALVSLAYNIGLRNFNTSGLLKQVNLGNFDIAAERFLLWDKASGREVPGLMRRREQERSLFLTPVG